MPAILILEDNAERIHEFELAVAELGTRFQLHLWRDAPSMMAQCLELLPVTALISLDHDLVPATPTSLDPGTGLEVAALLARQRPVCPVILHTSNFERRWSMHNELRFGGWQVEVVPPFDNHEWIRGAWLKKVRELAAAGNREQTTNSDQSLA